MPPPANVPFAPIQTVSVGSLMLLVIVNATFAIFTFVFASQEFPHFCYAGRD